MSVYVYRQWHPIWANLTTVHKSSRRRPHYRFISRLQVLRWVTLSPVWMDRIWRIFTISLQSMGSMSWIECCRSMNSTQAGIGWP
jgi:hypothetical protein